MLLSQGGISNIGTVTSAKLKSLIRGYVTNSNTGFGKPELAQILYLLVNHVDINGGGSGGGLSQYYNAESGGGIVMVKALDANVTATRASGTLTVTQTDDSFLEGMVIQGTDADVDGSGEFRIEIEYPASYGINTNVDTDLYFVDVRVLDMTNIINDDEVSEDFFLSYREIVTPPVDITKVGDGADAKLIIRISDLFIPKWAIKVS